MPTISRTKNKNLFFGQYTVINSFSFGTDSDLVPKLPQGQELGILRNRCGQIPESVFTTPYKNVGGIDDQDCPAPHARQICAEAVSLFSSRITLRGNQMDQ